MQTTAWRGRRKLNLVLCLRSAMYRFFRDGGPIMAGHLAFMAILTLFPFLIFLTALAGFLGQGRLGTDFIGFVFTQLPVEVADVLLVPLQEVLSETRGDLLTLGILLALWTASSGFEAARTAVDHAYASEQSRPFWRGRLESILLVIAVSVAVLVAMLALILGPVLVQRMQAAMALPEQGWLRWVALRYGFGTLLLFLAIAALYFVLPAARLKWRWVLPGTVLVVALWLAAATAFSYYVERIAAYTVTYGSLAGVIVALIFFYLLAAIFVFGAEFNAAIARFEGGLPPPRRRRLDPRPPAPEEEASN